MTILWLGYTYGLGTGMDWEALVQSLWEIIHSQGFDAFEAHLRCGVLDQPIDGLVQALDALHKADASDVFQALLLESLKNSPFCDRIKHRLQMSLRFQIPHADGHLTLIEERTFFLENISVLVTSNRFAEAIANIHAAIERKQDSDLLELLGRVYLLQCSHDTHISGAAEKQVTTHYDIPQEFNSFGSEGDFDLFVWQDSPVLQKSTHDNECIEAAVEVQALISGSIPAQPKAMEWCIDLDDGEPPPSSSFSSEAAMSATEKLSHDDLSTSDVIALNNLDLKEGQSSLEDMTQEASRRYFDFQILKLQPEDKELLGIIRANPKIEADKLARAMEMRPPILNHTLGTRLRYWIERDRLGGFSIKRELLSLLSDSTFERHEHAAEKKSIDPMPKTLSTQDEKEVRALPSDVPTLSDQANQVIRYFTQNPGKKTYEGADALKLNHMTLLSLLDGCLEEYLERDRGFAVRPRLQASLEEARAPLTKSALQLPDSEEIPSGSAMTKIQTPLTQRTIQVAPLTEPAVLVTMDVEDADVTVTDLAKAAAISRLSPLGKQILALLASEGKGYSRDLARKLEHDVDEVNKMLLRTLSEHVSVIHSVWRLNKGMIKALKLAAII
ncbi:hypothetical protein [Pseudomonas sp. BE134]|uniref:hypothetical protein n=1 Tax=Pseudomonas sp. BE134 TaxID=2817843 RepID=UPI0028555132|nr:hypothetical protein [Pseudomonas sp. BE134]MDR6926476.1 hypothetical protein [Pseudomonas sp. BE134]